MEKVSEKAKLSPTTTPFGVLGKCVGVYLPIVGEKTSTGILLSPEVVAQRNSDLENSLNWVEVHSVGDEVVGIKPGDKVRTRKNANPLDTVLIKEPSGMEDGKQVLVFSSFDVVCKLDPIPSE